MEDFDDPQPGVHNIESDPVTAIQDDDEDDFDAEFEIDTEAVFKRLARDIYEGDNAGIRETITNSITATLKAVKNDFIDQKEATVKVTLRKEGSSLKLSIRDNGIGMTMQKIRKIVSVIGVSQSRDSGELAGQFGMGFLAAFRLVGFGGGFEMHTNPRYSNEGPISGFWNSGGFTQDKKEMISDGFNEYEYGTEFSFVLKEDLEQSEIRNWVEKYASWSRVPVIYEEYVDGKTNFQEDYGGPKKSISSYDNTQSPVVSFENEYVHAVTSPEAEGKTILLDIPCSRDTDVDTVIGTVDIRIKNENRVVVDGPNKGKMVISDDNYRSIEDEREEYYIPEDEVTQDDVVSPEPVGTRESLRKNREFWKWVSDNLDRRVYERARDALSDVSSYDNLMNLEPSEFSLAIEVIRKVLRNTSFRGSNSLQDSARTFQKRFNNRLDMNLDIGICKRVYMINEFVHVGRTRSKDGLITNLRYGIRGTAAIYDTYHSDGDIYMGVSPSDIKVKVVNSDEKNNQLCRLNESEMYSEFESLFRWERISNINSQNIDEFNIPDDVREEFIDKYGEPSQKASKTTEPAVSNSISLHTKKFGDTQRVDFSDLSETIESQSSSQKLSLENGIKVKNVIAFPDHMSKNISDNQWIVGSQCVTFRCTKEQWEDINEYEKVYTVDSLLREKRAETFTSSNGTLTVEEFEREVDLDEERIMFHVLSEEFKSVFSDKELIEIFEDYVNEAICEEFRCTYAPITPSEYRSVKPAVARHPVLIGDFSSKTGRIRDYYPNTQKKRVFRVRTETRMYATARLQEWSETEEFDQLYKSIARSKIDEGGYDLVETVFHGFKNMDT